MRLTYLLCKYGIAIILIAHSSQLVSAEYTFGVLPQFPEHKTHQIWQPILAELSDETGHNFKLISSRSNKDFERNIELGTFDFAYMSPFHLIMINGLGNYLPLVKDGSRQLQGVLVVRKDSRIKKLTDLRGQIIAFPSDKALAASLVMRAELKQLHDIEVSPVYVESHTSVYLNVVLQQTVAGGGVRSTLNNQQQEVKEQLTVIYETQLMNPHPISAHSRVDKHVIQQVRQRLIDMGHDPNKQLLLKKIPMVQPIPAQTKDYLFLKDMRLDKFYVDG